MQALPGADAFSVAPMRRQFTECIESELHGAGLLALEFHVARGDASPEAIICGLSAECQGFSKIFFGETMCRARRKVIALACAERACFFWVIARDAARAAILDQRAMGACRL